MKKNNAKYMRIRNHVLRDMETRHIKDRVPSENELARTFDVSRMTARKALDQLHHEGYVERIPGKGTFLKNKKPFSHRFFQVHPFSDNARTFNVETASKLIAAKKVKADQTIAARIGTPHAVRVKRVHYFDEQPACFEDRYLRDDICGAIVNEDLEKESIHQLLIHKYDLTLTKVWQRLEALGLSKNIADFLNAAPNDPALCMRQTVYAFDQPVTYVKYFMRNDFYAFEDTFEPHLDAGATVKDA